MTSISSPMLEDEVCNERTARITHITSISKMSSHDLVRVFKGVGLVVDHLVVMNKYGLREKLTRAQFHVSELMKVGYEIGGDMSATEAKSHTDDSHRSSNNVDPRHDHYSPSSATHPTTSTSAAPYVPPFVTTHKETSSTNTVINTAPFTKVAPLSDPVASVPHVDTAATESLISIPISIDDFKTINAQSVNNVAPQKGSEDLIGFDPRIKESAPLPGKQTGARDANTVVNGVRTSSMRERAVPATQLVSFLEILRYHHKLRHLNYSIVKKLRLLGTNVGFRKLRGANGLWSCG